MKIKKLFGNAILPTRADDGSAGLDLYACSPYTTKINPHETVKVGTGIAIELPDGTFGGIYARSGIATKRGLAPANAVGVVDESYRGEIIVALHNFSDEVQEIGPYERIAQLIVQPYVRVSLEEVEELSETIRGEGGFGHSGK